MLRQMNGRKEAKRKKKWRMDQGRFFWIPLPPVFIHFLITFVSFFLSFAFCPIGFSLPGFLKKIEIPRRREGGAHSGVHFLLESNSPLERNGFRRPGAELICALYRDCFLCKCYSSFSVLADLKTHFKITERT